MDEGAYQEGASAGKCVGTDAYQEGASAGDKWMKVRIKRARVQENV